MAGALNKRQQARNERALQELIKTVPGNDRCADCSARNPGWASWNLGIFLCVRCASLHRKVGTHVTKVKSLSMDSWSNEQVENMRRVGNATSNKTYNPRSVAAQLPVDADEVNGAMERYIRQKYELRSFNNDAPPPRRNNTGTTSTSTTSSDDRPPALPPKPKKSFFGLRSSSSTLAPRQDRYTPPISPSSAGFEPDFSPPRPSKALRFGSNVSSRSGESFDSKLAQLRDMGFKDERRNSTILKGLNGDLDRTVEALSRIGATGSHSPANNKSPAVPPKDDNYKAGISLQKTRQAPVNVPLTETPAAMQSSTNPFDRLDLPQTQRDQLHHTNSLPMPSAGPATQPTRSFTVPNAYNPFLSQAQPQSTTQPQTSLDNSFQAMSLSAPQPAQQLFPNATGGYLTQTQQQSNPFFQTYNSPPLAAVQQPSQLLSLSSQLQMSGIQQQNVQSQQSQNPFLRQSRSQTFAPSTFGSDAFSSPPAQMHSSNPFGSFPQAQLQSQQQSQQQPFTHPLSQQAFSSQPLTLTQPQHSNPFDQSSQRQQAPFYHNAGSLPTQSQPAGAQVQQGYLTSAPLRHDKSSILALYGMPQLAPQVPASGSAGTSGALATGPGFPQTQPSAAQGGTFSQAGFPSTTNGAMTGSHNPFGGNYGSGALAPVAENEAVTGPTTAYSGFKAPPMAAAGNAGGFAGAAQRAPGLGAGSRESVDFMGLSMSGRHSPDAFAGLSARPFVR